MKHTFGKYKVNNITLFMKFLLLVYNLIKKLDTWSYNKAKEKILSVGNKNWMLNLSHKLIKPSFL